MKLNKTVLIAVGIAIALVIGSIVVTYETKLADQKTENEKYVKALNDTLKVTKNKAGENVAKIRVLETKSEKDFLKLQSNDADIKTLQDRVAYYKGKAESVVTFTQQGTVTGTTNTQITHKDTTGLVKCDSCPVYTNTFTDS